MDLTLLTTLKTKLTQAKEFADVWKYFLDHFGEDTAFIKLGERVKEHPILEAVVQQIGLEVFKAPIALSDLLLTRLPEQQFIHGSGVTRGNVASLLYFEDIHVGLMAIISPSRTNEVKYSRFSTLKLSSSGIGQ